MLAGLFALLVAIAGVIAVALTASSPELAPASEEPGPSVMAAPNSVAVIDPRTNELVASIPVGAEPGPIAVGGGSVWVANVEERTLTRIDAATREVVATVGLGVEPTGLAVGEGGVWIPAGFDRVLLRLDPANNRVRQRLDVREEIGKLPPGYELGPSDVAVGGGWVWLAHGEEVSRIDPATGRVASTIPAGGNWTGSITEGEGAAWVAENDRLQARRQAFEDGGVVKIDTGSSSTVARVSIPGLRPTTGGFLVPGALAAGEGALWAVSPSDHLVWRIDAGSGRVLATIQDPRSPGSLAVGEGGVWVEHHADQKVTRIDPFSNEVVATIEINRPTRGIAAGEGAVWVSVVS